ncbi:unnamed protein product [Rhizoctonia solani]|uniref:Zn(2)-C6 fungal-type domain-containing protein n=1 Tax=Rhizoctonia solani TaxID=456999 RepID=A0A8H3GBR1_9AGAM|nr:unnamed protein product [Rhizoctonia solani]
MPAIDTSNLASSPAHAPPNAGFQDAGDFTLTSSPDNVEFKVFRLFLMTASPVFQDILTSGSGPPVMKLSEDAETIAALLQYIYPRENPTIKNHTLLAKVLEAARKYEMGFITSDLRASMRSESAAFAWLRTEPLQIYALTVRHELKEEIALAAKLTIGKYDFASRESMSELCSLNIPSRDVVMLMRMHMARAEALSDLLVNAESNPRCSVGFPIRCSQCKQEGGSVSELQKAWTKEVVALLRKEPLDKAQRLFEKEFFLNLKLRSKCYGATESGDMSASEKDLNNISPSHTGSNVAGNTSHSGGPISNHDATGAYFGHLHYPQQVNNNPATTSKPPSQSQKVASSQKSAVNSPPTPVHKAKQTHRPPANSPATVKPSATTNTPAQPPKNAPAPTPPGSAAVMAAVMAQAQAAAGQAVAAQQANKQQPQPQQQPTSAPVPMPTSTSAPAPTPAPAPASTQAHPPPIPPPQAPQPYHYPYPYYLPPAQPGAPPYLYPGAPGAPAFLPAGTPGQGGAPPPGYPYMYPMYPAPIPVPQASPAPVPKEKKSQRTYQACQKCRQWKAKCNGLKPCNHCQKRGVTCEYAERRNMTSGEQSGSQEESSQPGQPEAKPTSGTSDTMDPTAFNNTQPQSQPSPPASSNPPPPPPPGSHPPVQPTAQNSPPNASSPPHQTQMAQPPPPMAIYPPPPPGYAYPPQLYHGMPFPAPGPDPNAPYPHFVGMQYAQPYAPYMWAPPPPPPGHEQVSAAHVGESEEGERDADGKLKIKRTFQACQKCRQRKAKCNGVRPSCQHCASRGLVCEYAKERSKPRGTNGEEGEEALDAQGTESPATMDPTQAMVSTVSSPVNANQQPAPGAPPVPTTAPPNMFPPPFPYDPNAYNPHVDPHQHGAQPMYPFPPYGYGHPPGFGSIAGPPLVHIGEEGSVPPYHAAVPPPTGIPGPPPSNSPSSGSSKRPRTIRPPGAQGMGKSRIFQACERCRERKAKCDGVRPICTHCSTRDLSCEWADKRRMRGPAKGITPRRTRQEGGKYGDQENMDMNTGMQAIPLGLNAAELQQIEPHTSTTSDRKRKRRSSHSSGSPSPSDSSSSSESSPSESDDDDADRNSTMGIGTGVVSGGWS